jgi:F-type H+-transporting ATPase subunit b
VKIVRTLALTVGAAAALAGGIALAQPQPQPQPPQLQGRPGPGRPPTIVGPDGRVQGMPGGRPGRPAFPPGFQPPGRPGAPPGIPGRPGSGPGRAPFPPGTNPPRPHRPPVEPEEEHEHECPGHGPDDSPPPVNLWHGLIGVNNERAQQGDFLSRLLFRYENPKDPCDAKNEPPPYTASLLNFGILAFIVYRFGKKPLAEGLAKRKQTITAEIDAATKLKSDAEARLDEYEDKLENIEGKLEEVRAEYAAQAEIEKTHLLAEAEERRVRMRRDAEFRIEQELKTVREELLREAVIAATAAADALVVRQISSADQDRMARDFLAAIGPALSTGARS